MHDAPARGVLHAPADGERVVYAAEEAPPEGDWDGHDRETGAVRARAVEVRGGLLTQDSADIPAQTPPTRELHFEHGLLQQVAVLSQADEAVPRQTLGAALRAAGIDEGHALGEFIGIESLVLAAGDAAAGAILARAVGRPTALAGAVEEGGPRQAQPDGFHFEQPGPQRREAGGADGRGGDGGDVDRVPSGAVLDWRRGGAGFGAEAHGIDGLASAGRPDEARARRLICANIRGFGHDEGDDTGHAETGAAMLFGDCEAERRLGEAPAGLVRTFQRRRTCAPVDLVPVCSC